MIQSLKGVFTRRGRNAEFYECRRCGTTVDPSATGCPACGSSEIAHYDL